MMLPYKLHRRHTDPRGLRLVGVWLGIVVAAWLVVVGCAALLWAAWGLL